MVDIRIRVARRTGIEMSAGAVEVPLATAHCMDVDAVHARRNSLQVVDNLDERTVGHLIFVELDGARNFSTFDFRGRFLDDVLIDRDAPRGCACRSGAATTCAATT